MTRCEAQLAQEGSQQHPRGLLRLQYLRNVLLAAVMQRNVPAGPCLGLKELRQDVIKLLRGP